MKTVCPFCQLTRSRRHREPLRDFRSSMSALGYHKLRYAHSECIIPAIRAAQARALRNSDRVATVKLQEILR